MESSSGGDTFDGMEHRVVALENTMTDIKIMLARMDERMATKDDINKLSVEIGEVKGELRGKLSFWQFLFVVGAFLAIVLRWPELFRMAGLFH